MVERDGGRCRRSRGAPAYPREGEEQAPVTGTQLPSTWVALGHISGTSKGPENESRIHKACLLVPVRLPWWALRPTLGKNHLGSRARQTYIQPAIVISPPRGPRAEGPALHRGETRRLLEIPRFIIRGLRFCHSSAVGSTYY